MNPQAPLFNILSLPATKDHLEAFNDLALQWAPAERIDEQLPAFWDELEETAEVSGAEAEVGKPREEQQDEKKKAMDRIQSDLVAALSRASLN